MEFETTDSYGPKGPKTGRVKCNLGCIYSSKLGQPLLVTSQTGPESVAAEYATIYPKPAQTGEICRATHTKTGKDSLTGYDAPLAMKFEWEGKEQDKSTPIKADVEVQTSLNEGEGGLIQKVRHNVVAFESIWMLVLTQFAVTCLSSRLMSSTSSLL